MRASRPGSNDQSGQAAVRSGAKERLALRLKGELDHPERVLIVLHSEQHRELPRLLGIAGILSVNGIGPWAAIVINAVILIPLLFIVAETLPKDLFDLTDHWTYHFGLFIRINRMILTILECCRWFEASLLFTRYLGGPDRTRSARQRVLSLVQEGVGSGVLSSTPGRSRRPCIASARLPSKTIRWRQVRTVPLLSDRATRESILRSCDYARLPWSTAGDGSPGSSLPWMLGCTRNARPGSSSAPH